MLNIRSGFTLVLGIIIFWGCGMNHANTSVPRRYGLATSGYGSFLQVTYKAPSGGVDRFAGEFIGFRNDSIFALNQDGWLIVPQKECSSAILIMFKNSSGLLVLPAIFGPIISGEFNGGFAIISGSMWIAGSLITGITEGMRPNNFIYPSHSWHTFTPYARFPQGVPISLDLSSLTINENYRYIEKDYVMY